MRYKLEFKRVALMVFGSLVFTGLLGCKEEKVKEEGKRPCECKGETLIEKTFKDKLAKIKFDKISDSYVIALTIEDLSQKSKISELLMKPCNEALSKELKVNNLDIVLSGVYRLCSENIVSCPECRLPPPYYKIEVSSIKIIKP